jgi:hypothetical protein
MRDEKQIQELEGQIARDEQRYREILRLEEELMQSVPRRGFAAASTEGRYRTEKQSLDETIFRNKGKARGSEKPIRFAMIVNVEAQCQIALGS